MKQTYINLTFISLALLSGVVMFLLKYHVLEREKFLYQMNERIYKKQHELHMLQAEWAYLTDPKQLKKMAESMQLNSLGAKQVVDPESIKNKVTPTPMNKPKEVEEDV